MKVQKTLTIDILACKILITNSYEQLSLQYRTFCVVSEVCDRAELTQFSRE